MKVNSKYILKPGAKLIVEKIDWTSPDVQKFVKAAKREQKKAASRHPRNWTQKQWDMLNNVITI